MKKIRSSELNEENLKNYISRGAEDLSELKETVQSIISEVIKNGEIAIMKYNKKFSKFNENVDISTMPLLIPKEEIKEAYTKVDKEVIEALKRAKANIESFHKAQVLKDWEMEQQPGVKVGQVFRPLESVGLYAPGGEGVYPSSVLMTVIPAKVAGVKRLVLVSPPQADGKLSPAILVAADLCEVNEIYRVGGAQAIAFLAYGTKNIKPVLKIMGPGNKYVNAAKQLVSAKCAIDTPAGPSDILIIADKTAKVEDLLIDFTAQIEHGPDNVGVLVSDSKEIIDEFMEKINDFINSCKRNEYIRKSADKFGLVVEAIDMADAIRISDLIAPEHLHIQTSNPEAILQKIGNAGAIFIGSSTPVALGDYCAGTNHVLPTGGYSKMYSGLSTMAFMKTMDVLKVDKNGLVALEPIIRPIAEYEGFFEHRNSVTKRVEKIQDKKKWTINN